MQTFYYVQKISERKRTKKRQRIYYGYIMITLAFINSLWSCWMMMIVENYSRHLLVCFLTFSWTCMRTYLCIHNKQWRWLKLWSFHCVRQAMSNAAWRNSAEFTRSVVYISRNNNDTIILWVVIIGNAVTKYMQTEGMPIANNVYVYIYITLSEQSCCCE